jgi:hypothetical protein
MTDLSADSKVGCNLAEGALRLAEHEVNLKLGGPYEQAANVDYTDMVDSKFDEAFVNIAMEENIDVINPEPMDMDDTDYGEDDKKSEDNGSSKQNFGSLTLEQHKQHAVSTGNGATGSNIGKKVTDQGVQTLLGSQPSVVDTQIVSGKDTSWALAPGSPNVSTLSADLNMADVGILSPEVLALAAVSEANNSAKLLRSKRRAATSMKDSVARATKLKAARNLDSAFAEGTNCDSPLFFPSHASIVENLASLGFGFNNDSSSVVKFIDFLSTTVKPSSKADKQNLVEKAIDFEESEMYGEQELEKVILKNICNDSLDEFMDTNSELQMLVRTAVSHKQKGKGRHTNNINTVSK